LEEKYALSKASIMQPWLGITLVRGVRPRPHFKRLTLQAGKAADRNRQPEEVGVGVGVCIGIVVGI
jgi:hypothetical protein